MRRLDTDSSNQATEAARFVSAVTHSSLNARELEGDLLQCMSSLTTISGANEV